MHIDYLCEHIEHIPTVATWHQKQWGYLSPTKTVEERRTSLEAQQTKLMIPTTFVALEDREPVGCASLVQHDMDTRMELTPWLASLYVTPSRRQQGIGTALVDRVVEEARALDIGKLFLYTPDRAPFYAQRGWLALEERIYRGYAMVVMVLEIEPAT